jgi:hypothetical protein
MSDLPNGTQLKPVHANVWSSHDAIFKSSRKDHAEVQIILCGRSEDCELFAKDQCSYRASFGWHACPYGHFRKYEGPTPRARAYSKWIEEQKKKYEGVPYLKDHTDMIAFIGDYVFLPYTHMDMADVGWIQKNGGFLGKGCAFLKKELFTVENIEYLIHFRPQSWGGGEIVSYQKEEVPKFVKHLQEKCPDLFKELLEYDPTIQKIVDAYSYIGRKAILQTLTPNIGKFVDIHKGEWIWDGIYLTSLNSHASFMLVDKFEEIKVKPKEQSPVVISDDNQVNEKTKFLS